MKTKQKFILFAYSIRSRVFGAIEQPFESLFMAKDSLRRHYRKHWNGSGNGFLQYGIAEGGVIRFMPDNDGHAMADDRGVKCPL